MNTPHQPTATVQVLVFEINIYNESDVDKAGFILNNYHAIQRWTVDLLDWERVLRIEASTHCDTHQIEKLIKNLGYRCNEMMH